MALRQKPLSEQVIVITGASSGIGLATALMAGRNRARLVLAARNEEALREAVQTIEARGGQAVAVAADVTKPEDIQKICDTAMERFGTIDTWVNNAGVSIFGRLTDVKEEDQRQLFETNFWGMVHGSLTAVKVMRQRGGTLINLGSVASDMVFPLQGMYCASKHAVKAFTDALRMELEKDRVPIQVTLIKPAAIGTPFVVHAKNYMEQEARLPPPIYAPEDVAHAILFAATHPRRDIYVGGAAIILSLFNRNLPRVMDIVGRRAMFRAQQKPEPAQPHLDNLHSMGGNAGQVRAGNVSTIKSPMLYTRTGLAPVIGSLAMMGAGVALSALFRRRGLPISSSWLRRLPSRDELRHWRDLAERAGERLRKPA